MSDIHKIPLSVIVATTNPWPEIQDCLNSVYHQIEETGSELIIATGVNDAIPEQILKKYKHLKMLFFPGADVFELRARVLALAKGEIIAITEDHCTVSENWCAGIIKSHQDNPDFPAISGAILNGSPHSLFDRANYFSIFSDFLPPIQADKINHVPPAANASFKRSGIKNADVTRGWLEIKYSMELLNEHRYHFDESFSVHHIQSHGNVWGNCTMHFHNGRATTGMLQENMAIKHRNKKIKGLITLPFRLVHETQKKLSRKPVSFYQRTANIFPLFLITLSHTLGELIGLLYGPGKSVHELN